MKKFTLYYLLIISLFCPIMAFAHLAVKLDLNRKTFIQYENICAKVILRNHSAHSLVFGNNEKLRGNLKFNIESPSGGHAELLSNGCYHLDQCILGAGKTNSVVVHLPEMYNLRSLGKYTVTAIVSHPMLPDSYQSNSVIFNVVEGKTVWDAIVGVPGTGELKDKEKIQKRHYRLLSFFDGKKQVYCLKVEDDKYVYGVARLGYDIGNRGPECKVDSLSKVHILIQSSPKIYSYFVYDTDCHLEEREVYKRTATEPCLVRDSDSGNIFVTGGAKAQEGKDYILKKDENKLAQTGMH